ncbi:hypothetical protein [Streptomyces sp. NPDC056982]|uniref:hypothetical protein n=1 Tax=Streptomyces sp. NPDC056982 TaxID=3345986 RepID=UPI00363195A0
MATGQAGVQLLGGVPRELMLAVTAGFPPEKIMMDGNAKSPDDLRTDLNPEVGHIAVNSASEIANRERTAAGATAGYRAGCAQGSHMGPVCRAR